MWEGEGVQGRDGGVEQGRREERGREQWEAGEREGRKEREGLTNNTARTESATSASAVSYVSPNKEHRTLSFSGLGGSSAGSSADLPAARGGQDHRNPNPRPHPHSHPTPYPNPYLVLILPLTHTLTLGLILTLSHIMPSSSC